MKFSIIGLGKLGASMTAAIAKRGFNVIGVDVNQRNVDMINEGHAPVQETDLEKTIQENKSHIIATSSYQMAVMNTDVTFVIVPTPSNDVGAFSLEYAKQAFTEIGKVLKDKDIYHLVVLTSTVLPGSMRYGLLPILEKESGKKCGVDFGLCYSPEFIALGSIIQNFLNPDFTLVGEYDEESGECLETVYDLILENHAPCKRMSFENAELAKVALNSYVTTKITYANMLGDLCEKIPGGNADVVTDAIGTDTRIGHKYFHAGNAFGGCCFPRDNIALTYFANKVGVYAPLLSEVDICNHMITDNLIDRIMPLVDAQTTIAILGLAYKQYSSVIEESQGIELADAFSKMGIKVNGYDTLANENARKALPEVDVLDSLNDCLSNADIVIVTIPDPLFKKLPVSMLKKNAKVTVVDYWRILGEDFKNNPNINYIPVGCSVNEEENAENLKKLWQ
jgi:UDPglucose 6-dehydrogenase